MPDKKRALILQHIIENPAGRVGVILDEYKIPFPHLCPALNHPAQKLFQPQWADSIASVNKLMLMSRSPCACTTIRRLVRQLPFM
jgi:hypothetical protein